MFEQYPNIQAALRDFQALVGFVVDSTDKAKVVALIEENGLSRRFVADLAKEVFVEIFNPGPILAEISAQGRDATHPARC